MRCSVSTDKRKITLWRIGTLPIRLAKEVLPVGYFLRPNITPNALDNFSSCFRSFSVRILSWYWTALLDGSSVKAWKRKLINFRWVNLRFIWKFPDSYWTQIYRDRAVELQIDPRRRSLNTARLFFNWHVVFIPFSRFYIFLHMKKTLKKSNTSTIPFILRFNQCVSLGKVNSKTFTRLPALN